MKHATTSIASPEVANGHQALSGYIKARFDEFSRSQKDVAQYIVDHLDEAAFQTAEELARRANTSSSTVVRFSQALGFEGFPELQQAARDEYRRRGGGAGALNRCSPWTTPSSRRRSPPTTSTSRTPRTSCRARMSRRRSTRSSPPTGS
jgi:DNA-binding MurR/RpiR family transcriptional regulator